jgi:hypothetical protein
LLLFGLLMSWWLAMTLFVMAMCRTAATGDYARWGPER